MRSPFRHLLFIVVWLFIMLRLVEHVIKGLKLHVSIVVQKDYVHSGILMSYGHLVNMFNLLLHPVFFVPTKCLIYIF